VNSNQTLVSKIEARFYPDFPMDALDAAFCSHARVGMRVLDAGCGPARGCSSEAPLKDMFIVGVDIDPEVHKNPFCNETAVCDLSKKIPFDDASFDLVHCRWAFEHLEDPLTTFREFSRILKPGGFLLALTPNLCHYATIAAKVTPHWFHRWWRRVDAEEAFPTYYRANTPRKLRKICKKTGFEVQRLDIIEVYPQYFTRNWFLFLCGVFYERLVNSTSLLKWFRQRIILEAVATLPEN
jgi:SAM-dependent methyltransferase